MYLILRKNSEGKYETFISDAEVKENKIVVDDGTLINVSYFPSLFFLRISKCVDLLIASFETESIFFILSAPIKSLLMTVRWLKNSVIFDMEIMRSEK
jgi:hypothetical protein